jgi:hypothetical protein
MKGHGMRVKGLMPMMTLLIAGASATFQLGANAAPPASAGLTGNLAFQSLQRARYGGVHSQIPNVAVPIGVRYPRAATIGLAIVVVPDPLVPRYRRLYDLSISALELGMLKDGYVLDRYSFPWDEELRRAANPDSPAAQADKKDDRGEAVESSGLNSGSYGLIVFRCDTWRGDVCRYPDARAAHDDPPNGNPPSSIPPSRDPQSSGPQSSGPQSSGAAAHFRALYVVTETATSGVARRQLRCAIRKIESQTSPQRVPPDATCPDGSAQGGDHHGRHARDYDERHDYNGRTTLLEYPVAECRPASGSAPDLVVLGPNFSGSLDSIGVTVDGVLTNTRRACLIASSATDLTNRKVSEAYPSIRYQTTALEHDKKMRDIARLARTLGVQFGGDSGDVAILAEASTFGYGVCKRNDTVVALRRAEKSGDIELVDEFCKTAKFYFFPPTLADIRFGLQKQQSEQANELAGAKRQVENDRHLPLEAAAENGSEFPESHQSAVTAAGIQLQLDKVFAALVESAPKIIIVAATDVRDRLFLFDQLREKLPRALLIDLEADTLMGHPEYLHATRGALATASANLTSRGKPFGCEPTSVDSTGAAWSTTHAAWSTDTQGILAENVARLHESDPSAAPAEAPCGLYKPADAVYRQAALQVVTFNGFTPIGYAFPYGMTSAVVHDATRLPRFDLLPRTQYLSLLFCLAMPCIWLWPWGLQPMSDASRIRLLQRAPVEFIVIVIASICCLPVLGLAPFIAYLSSVQPAHPLTYWVSAIEIIGVIGLWRCYVQIRHTLWSANHRYHYGNLLACGVALGACLFAYTPIWMQRYPTPSPVVDETLITALGFDPFSGLGFYLVVALTTLLLMYASAILATRTWVVRRNFHLLFLAHEMVPGSTPFVVKKEREQSVESQMSAPHCYRPPPLWTIVSVVAVVIFTLAAPGLLDQLGGPRLTVFGPFAARVAVLALAATTLCGAVLVAGVYGAGRRINMLSGYIRSRAIDHLPAAKPRDTGEILDTWAGGSEMPVTFPATPVLARVGGGGAFRRRRLGRAADGGTRAQQVGLEWARSLSEILFKGNWDSTHRLALYALLAAEISLLRWIALGAILCALGGVTIAYLYPIEADSLLVLDLGLLATTGVLSAYLAVQFETDEVLSYVLCNRPKKAQMSVGLFTYVASPFVALAAAAAIVGLPGVVDWAGGLYAMLRALGVHG